MAKDPGFTVTFMKWEDFRRLILGDLQAAVDRLGELSVDCVFGGIDLSIW